jgi:hypothetical protein
VRRRIAEFFDSNILVLNTPCTTKQIAGFANGRGDEVEVLLKQVGGENGTIDNVALGKWLKGIRFSKLKSMAQNPLIFTKCGGDVARYGFLR